MVVPSTVNDQVVYAPRSIYTTENVLLDLEDDSRLDIFGNVYLNGNRLSASSYIDIRDYGARGDGITDDTVAVQNALNAAGELNKNVSVILNGTHLITDHLYIYGKVTVTGGELLLSGAATAHGLYWINCGIKGYGATNGNGLISTWTGKLDSVKIRTTVTTVMDRVINVHNGADWWITGCTFDFTVSGLTAIGAIGCYNNANFCNPPSKVRGHIVGNSMIAAQGSIGSEAIGVGSCNDIWITDNYVYGFGDDPIGIHACTNFTCTGNRVHTPDGRIYISGSKDGIVSDNYVTRIPKPDTTVVSGGAMIQLEVEGASNPAPTRISIMNNTVVHAAGLVSATYGIRFRGGVDCKAIGNTVLDTSGFGYGITWEQQDASGIGWTDPDDTEVDQISRVQRLTVADNRVNTSAAFKIEEVSTASATGVIAQANGSGNYATVAGGNKGVASGNRAAIVGGNLVTASGDYTVAGGNGCVASASYAVAMGDTCTASGIGSVAIGARAIASRQGQFAFASGNIAAVGDAQMSVLVAKRQTTNATASPLGLSGIAGSGPIALPDDTTWAFSILLVGRRADADNESAGYKFEGVIDRNSGAATTALVGTVVKTVMAEDTVAWEADVTANTTDGGPRITVTGEAAKTINWVARVDLVQITG